MLDAPPRWSHARGNGPVPSRWQATRKSGRVTSAPGSGHRKSNLRTAPSRNSGEEPSPGSALYCDDPSARSSYQDHFCSGLLLQVVIDRAAVLAVDAVARHSVGLAVSRMRSEEHTPELQSRREPV